MIDIDAGAINFGGGQCSMTACGSSQNPKLAEFVMQIMSAPALDVAYQAVGTASSPNVPNINLGSGITR